MCRQSSEACSQPGWRGPLRASSRSPLMDRSHPLWAGLPSWTGPPAVDWSPVMDWSPLLGWSPPPHRLDPPPRHGLVSPHGLVPEEGLGQRGRGWSPRPDQANPIRSSTSWVCFLINRRFGITSRECCAGEGGDFLSVSGVALRVITPQALLMLIITVMTSCR